MSIYDYKAKTRKGEEMDLAELKGKVLLIVNTATGCGFTPQYEGIEQLYETYHDQGFEVLDFPCNQFGHQAPGSMSSAPANTRPSLTSSQRLTSTVRTSIPSTPT